MFIRLLKWMMLAMTINVALTPWGTQWAIYAGYATIVLTLVAAIVGNRGRTRLELNQGIVAVFMLFLAMCIGWIVDSDELKFNIDYLKMVISFFCFFVLVNLKPQKHSIQDLRDIFWINKLLSGVYILYTCFPFSFRYTAINKWGDMAFTMNMGNSNATSILVMFCIALLCLELRNEERRFMKIINIAMILALMYTLVMLKSRTAVASMLLVIACVWIKNLKLRPWYGILIVLVPIAYFVIQIMFRELTGFLIFDKELNTGRGDMFVEHFNAIKDAPGQYIVGSTMTHQFANYHNAPIAIVSNFGFVGLIGYLMFWKYQLKTLIDSPERTMFQTLAVVVLFAFVVHSSAEASPMLGNIPYSSAVILIARLAKDQFEEPASDNESLPVMAQNAE